MPARKLRGVADHAQQPAALAQPGVGLDAALELGPELAVAGHDHVVGPLVRRDGQQPVEQQLRPFDGAEHAQEARHHRVVGDRPGAAQGADARGVEAAGVEALEVDAVADHPDLARRHALPFQPGGDGRGVGQEAVGHQVTSGVMARCAGVR